MRPGISGALTRAFIVSPLTPLLLLISFSLGLMALMALPREEEPQIIVPLVDVMVNANGLKAADAVELVTEPLEDIIKGIADVEHVYSQTVDDRVVVTARFFVGTDEDRAAFRVNEEIRANLNQIPYGIPEPLIVGRGINDVPIVTLTLSPNAESEKRWDDNRFFDIAEELRHELSKIDDVSSSFISGGRPDQIRIEPDPERLALHGVTLSQLTEKVRNANRSFLAGNLRERNRSLPLVAGQTLTGIPDIGLLLITTRDGRAVYVRDVADVIVGGKPTESRVWHLGKNNDGTFTRTPAVTLSFAKRAGANAVLVAERVLERLELARGKLVPDSVRIDVTRNYGKTASDKADELLFHLALATVSIVILVTLALGWREGLVVAITIPTTILLTLFAAWLMNYTINRVSLFALIFSIGILVDDAIVIVENIARHWRMNDGRQRILAAIDAVSEVGNPTIIATLTIIAALLPMMFVSGLMGPYMSPIPVIASAAMMFSFFVAVMVTPWLLTKISSNHAPHDEGEGRMGILYRRIALPVLASKGHAATFLVIVGIATVLAVSLFASKTVTVKLLPFDNKSELQVIVDLPEGASLEATERVLLESAGKLTGLSELESIQVYAGTSAPFNFNGLVRHYYLRNQPWMGDLQINLTDKSNRQRQSHDIALDVRERLAGLDLPEGTNIKVAEVPPGPPVLATLIAEIYGPDMDTRRATMRQVRKAFEAVDYVVDVDDTLGSPPQRLRMEIDQENLEFYGVEEQALFDTIQIILGGVRVGYSHRGAGVNPIEITVQMPKSGLFLSEHLLSTPIPAPGVAADSGRNVELGDVIKIRREKASYPIFRHNGRFAEMVTGELAGRFEAPVYAMFDIASEINSAKWPNGNKPEISFHGQPRDESKTTLLWDGEWEVTYVTFRDMGLAFGFALFGIYVLVLGQFGSFKLPLVILTPVPLTMVGIMLGHWLFGAPFTATSMIGFIALAGIIVRNSILLVDFIRHLQMANVSNEISLRDILLEAGAIRVRPILLTALAAMVGAAFILTDPVFQGLAISLVFGLASSTLLTLLVIPAIYVVLRGK